jgi:predicted flap endonuclease-1-like 5' DNA nuclease
MKRSDNASQAVGSTEAEAFESTAAQPMGRRQADDLRDLVRIGDFLAPEAHRQGGMHEAALAVRDWAEDDVAMIAAAENIARHEHQDDSAEILHRARILAAA